MGIVEMRPSILPAESREAESGVADNSLGNICLRLTFLEEEKAHQLHFLPHAQQPTSCVSALEYAVLLQWQQGERSFTCYYHSQQLQVVSFVDGGALSISSPCNLRPQAKKSLISHTV